jgi:hypothetical protein
MNYVLPIVGAFLVLNGIVTAANATAVMQQIVGELEFGFGVLAIGLGALIGVVKIGFARLEKQLSSAPKAAAPETAASSEQSPPSSAPMLDRLKSMRPWGEV